jgi:metallophosphoesterase (TIGR00282 family)
MKYTKKLREEKKIDIVVVNGENSAGGKGISRKSLDALYHAGADIVTSGNHIWDNKDVLGFIDQEPFLIRPANYPEGAPGKGWCIYPFKAKNIGVINLSGRAFMPDMDCPFQKIEDVLRELRGKCDIILLDFHAETTSEKMAMGWYLDGRVNVVVGTHTHIQTADERILPQGTAYITDLGMTGPWDSVLGVQKERILQKFTTCRPVRFELAAGPNVYSALLVELDDHTGRAISVERLLLKEEETDSGHKE